MFEIVNFENSDNIISLVESVHRDTEDFTEGDVFERIDAIAYYELVDFPIELLYKFGLVLWVWCLKVLY